MHFDALVLYCFVVIRYYVRRLQGKSLLRLLKAYVPEQSCVAGVLYEVKKKRLVWRPHPSVRDLETATKPFVRLS